jgi:serine/threonine protein kinase
MTDPRNSNKGVLASGGSRGGAEHQDTVMLSDVPDATTLLSPETPTAAAGLTQPSLNLSSSVLAALGQRYDVLAEAGRGSMGNVYKARDRETGETVALKLLKPEIASDQAMMDRFKNELLFARKITHKNICRVHEFNRISGVAFTSMEFVEGESLRSVLNRFGGLPVRKTLDLSLQMCSGLKEAHAQGIVHRDLKPENVMIDAQGNVKIMDFGIARSMESMTRLTGSMVGTPAYMAPEQVGGKPVDYRTDVYSLGLMLYEMFTGAPAFVADSPIAVAMKQLRESPRLPHEVEPTIPVNIERAILKCIEKEPARRFQSVAELEQVLRGATLVTPTVGMAAGIPAEPDRRAAAAVSAPNFGVSIPLKPARRRPVYKSLLIPAFAIVGGLACLHAMAVMKASKQIMPPATAAAPEPPEFALDKPIPEKEPDVAPGAAKVVAPASVSKPEAKAQPPAPVSKPKIAIQPPAPKPTVKQSMPNVNPTVELPGRKAFSPTPPKRPASSGQSSEPTAGQAKPQADAPSYIWVGRFTRRDKAQEASKKIEDLSLPVVIIPRRLPTGEAFAVFTGPFNEKKIGGVIDRLRGQGFSGAHIVTNPLSAPAKK